MDRRRLPIFSIVIVLIIFYTSILKYGVNIPIGDDYPAILNFLINFFSSSGFKKIALIFSQHNEHRIVFTRIITLLTYYLLGSINFKLLMFIGNLSLIGLLAVLYSSYPHDRNKLLYFLPVVLLLFQQQYWGDIYWAMASLSNLCVLFFAFLSLYLLTKPEMKYFFLSLFFLMLATFTNGNGFLVFFVGLFPVILSKHHKKILLWSIIGLGLILFYFHGYIKPAYHPSLLGHPIETLKYFFSFVGSSMGLTKFGSFFSFISLLTGLALSAYFILLIKFEYYKHNLPVYLFLLFCFLSAFMTSLGRAGFGIEQSLSSRYRIYSVLFFILIYISIMELSPNKIRHKIFPVLLSFSIIFNFCSYHYLKGVMESKLKLIDGIMDWENHNTNLLTGNKKFESEVMDTAIKKGYYHPPIIP